MGTDWLLGDVDANVVINAADAELVLKILTHAVAPDTRQIVVADANADDRIDSADAVLILRVADRESISPVGTKSLAKRFTGGRRALSLPSAIVNPGQIITVPVTLDSGFDVSGVDLAFAWPDQNSRFEGATATGLMSGFDTSVTDGAGFARVSLSSKTGLDSDSATEMVNLQFTVIGDLTKELNPPATICLKTAELKGIAR